MGLETQSLRHLHRRKSIGEAVQVFVRPAEDLREIGDVNGDRSVKEKK